MNSKDITEYYRGWEDAEKGIPHNPSGEFYDRGYSDSYADQQAKTHQSEQKPSQHRG